MLLRCLNTFKRLLTLVVIFLIAPVTVNAVPISISTVSELNFGILVQGDPSKIIPPQTVETLDNASFLVSGDPNTNFTIVLPTTSQTITTPGSGGVRTISVVSFQSNPSGVGLLSGAGTQIVFVGATLNAIPVFQIAGTYSGTFTVTVVY